MGGSERTGRTSDQEREVYGLKAYPAPRVPLRRSHIPSPGSRTNDQYGAHHR
uniref:Uncharacterized protein n=1 Tax=Peronospora matthiolae TaxID=2874970 RepID=A0AAV1V066_9STRA